MNKNKKKLLASGIICWFIVIAFLTLPFICLAAEGDMFWDSEGVRVAASFDDQWDQRLASDENGGAIIVWYEAGNIYAQHLDEDGNRLWAVDGVEIISSGFSPRITTDGAGGAIIAWLASGDIYVQRIDVSGTLLWGASGVLVGTGDYVLAITGDSSGGAFIVFSLTPKIAHINSSGVLTSPGVNGISLGGGVLTLGDPVLTQTGTNEVIVAWANGAKDILAQKVTSTLTLPWGATPVLVSGNARKEIRPEIADDGAGGAIITWARHPEVGQSDAHVVVQRIDSDGDCLWTPGGVILVDSSVVGGSDYAWKANEVAPVVASSSTGGAIIAWNDWRDETGTGGNDDLYAQRVDETGTPQWAANGLKLHSDPGNTSQRRPRIVSDGEYGAIVTFQDIIFYAYSIYAVGLDASGKKWSRYVYFDGDSNYSGNDQTDPRIIFDGTGSGQIGAIIAWEDERNSSDNIYAQKIENEYITPLPDLIVESIIIDPSSPEAYEAFTVDVTFRNQGTAEANIFECGFNSGTKPVSIWQYWYLFYGLEVGGTSTRQFDFPSGRAADTYTLRAAVDANSNVTESDETNNSLSVPLVIVTPADTDPPTPNPMAWGLEPYQTSTSSICMEAVLATDPSLPVGYFFNFTDSPTGGTGGSDSLGWSNATNYVDGGLLANHEYGYQVKARDACLNETGYSEVSYDYTDIETPLGVTFAGITTQSIQAGIIGKLSGLTRGESGLLIRNSTVGTDSAWKQDNDYWLSKGLSINTQYSFTAKARNGDSEETSWCRIGNIYTLAAVPGTSLFSNVTQNSITANWTANGNPKGTMFYCENVTDGTNSGWTIASSWVCKGLTCNTQYKFQVKARNGNGVETGWLVLGSQSTLPCSGYDGDFDDDGDVDGSDLVKLVNDSNLLALSTFAENFGKAD